jgi:hypothetical protein
VASERIDSAIAARSPPFHLPCSVSKPVSSVKPPFQPFQMSHHPTERVLAVSDIKEVITLYDQRMLPSTSSATVKPLATATGEAMEGVEEEEKKLGWAASETYTYPDTQEFAQKGAKVVVSPAAMLDLVIERQAC